MSFSIQTGTPDLGTVSHVHSPPPGGCDVTIAHSTQGVSVTVEVKGVRQDGETDEACATRARKLAHQTFMATVADLASAGVTVGKAAPK